MNCKVSSESCKEIVGRFVMSLIEWRAVSSLLGEL